MVNPTEPEVNTDIEFTIAGDYSCAACGSTAPPRRFKVQTGGTFVTVWAWCPAPACARRGPEAVYWQCVDDRPRGLVDPSLPYEVTP